MIFLSTSAMNPLKRKIITEDNYDTLLDFLQDHYPNGFDMPTDIHTHFKKIELDDYDMGLHDDAVVILVSRPAIAGAIVAAGYSALTAWLVQTAVMLAINFAISKLFMPDVGDTPQAQAGASTVYSLNAQQNRAKLGAPIPVGYGTFRMFPSYVEQPVQRFENNDEYTYLMLCIGSGRYSVDKLQVDNIDVTNHPDVEWKIINKKNFSDIPSYLGFSRFGYYMRNDTLSTPSNYEVKDVESRLFEVSPSTYALELDFEFPRGLVQISQEKDTSGKYVDWALNWEIRYYDVNKSFLIAEGVYRKNNTPTPVRVTIGGVLNGDTPVSPSSIKYFTVRRKDIDRKDSRLVDTLILKRVKERYDVRNVTEYGDITLLYVRLKATNAISSAGQQQVNGFFTRTDKSNSLKEVVTDIYTNTEYGAGLKASDLHLDATPETVNGVIETSMTVWDAMKRVTKAQKYTVYPTGQDILLKHDAPKTMTMGLYNETNIIKGSFSIQYAFKDEIESYDCIEVSYRSGADWNPSVERYPTAGILPQKVDLFGVTDQAKAQKMAKYYWKQDAFRNKVITFKTDIQSFTLEYLDKIKISHSALLWGTASEVLEVNGNTLTMSEKIDVPNNITFRNTDTSVSDMLPFTKVGDYTIMVNNLPTWVQDGTFATIGETREYLVVAIKPSDANTVEVQAVEYNEGIYS